MNKTALIDADSLLYFEMGKDTLEEAIQGINNRIQEILIKTECDHYIGYLTRGKCFRYDVARSKPYKYNRRHGNKPPIYYALDAYLQQDPWNFISFKGLEADDLVGIARTLNPGSIICSPDKDVLQQLPGKHYNYQKAQFHETTEDEAKAFLWKQVLMGDSTDGIPGIPGLGPKTADAIIDNMPSVLDCHQVVLSQYLAKFKLDQGISRFYETFKLVRMHTDIDIAALDVGEIPEDIFIPTPAPELLTAVKEEDSWE
tara:strand:+ start:100 stop:870 length:771 start_codon:yes stop_codon:yes gene_type:complete